MGQINNYKKLGTSSLIAKCADRDPLAWAEFINRFSPLVFRAVRKRLENHKFQFNKEDIEDLRQGFFIKLWHEKSLEKVKHSPNINYWLCMVAANFATDFYRRSRKDILSDALSLFEDVVIKNKKTSLANLVKSDLLSATKKIEKKHMYDLIEKSLTELHPKEKIVLKLNVFHNKKYRHISKILKMPIGNISGLLKSAKKKIKKYLHQNE